MKAETQSKFPFVENTLAIYNVSRDKHVDLGVAFNMLQADIRNGVNYNTELDLDFAAIKERWDLLSPEVQEAAREYWRDFDNRNFKDLAAARRAGDEKAFLAIVENG